jgi:hypothetical protein
MTPSRFNKQYHAIKAGGSTDVHVPRAASLAVVVGYFLGVRAQEPFIVTSVHWFYVDMSA